MAIATQLRISLLGRVTVASAGRAIGEASLAGRQNRLLFAYLVTELGKPVPRDELADALWGAEPPTSWEKALTVIASKVRALLAEAGVDGSSLASASGSYRLELPAGAWVDVFVAADAVDQAEAALRAGDLETAEECATLAESLARLPFLAGEDGSWVEARRRELSEVRVRSLDILSDAYLRAGDAATAARWAEQAVVLEPFRESGYRSLMEAQVAAGNRAEAFRVYERCRQLLAEELGAYPSPETEAIYRWLLEQPDDVGDAMILGEPLAWPSSRRRIVALAGAGVALAAIVAALFAIGGRGAPLRIVPNSLVRIDPHTLKVSRVIRVGDRPDLVVASGGYLWVTNHVLRGEESGALRNAGDRTLTRVDPSAGAAVVVGGGLAPCGLAASPPGDVWVANCFPAGSGSRDNVVRVSARTLQFTRTLPVVGGDGFYRGLAYGGGFLWISEVAGGDRPNPHAVIRIDPRTGAQHVYRLAREASGLAWSATGHDLWIVNFWNGSMTRLQPGKAAVQTIHAGTPSPAFPVAEGDAVWLGDWSRPQVVRLFAGGQPDPRKITLPVQSRSGVWSVAVDRRAVWAATPRDSALWRIDLVTGKTARIRLRYAPSGVVVDTSGIWVTIRKR